MQNPKSFLGPKQVALTFLAALVLYFSAFYFIEHVRHRKGPWEATFAVAEDGVPTVMVRQKALGPEGVLLRFPREKTPWKEGPVPVSFSEPGVEVPFGEVIYEDLTFLPGIVTFNLFGHLVEFMPRVLHLDNREVPWKPGEVHELNPVDKPATPPKPPPGGTREKLGAVN